MTFTNKILASAIHNTVVLPLIVLTVKVLVLVTLITNICAKNNGVKHQLH